MAGKGVARERFRQLDLVDSGDGYFLLDCDGCFLECSSRFLTFLRLPHESVVGTSITAFNCDIVGDHAFSQRALELQIQGEDGKEYTDQWLVDGRDLVVRVHLCALWDPESEHVVGYIGFVLDITDQERYRRLFKHLPVGAYRLNERDEIVDANLAFAKLLGYEQLDKVLGLRVQDVYASPSDATALREEVMIKRSVTRHVVELVKRSGEYFFGEVSSAGIFGPGPSREYRGREGTVVDVTAEERYRRSLDNVPVGFYTVRIENGEDLIRQCNRQFAAMFDFDSPDRVLGLPIKTLYAQASDYDVFMEELRAKDLLGLPLEEYPLRVVTRTGREKVIEVNSSLQKDQVGRPIGRTGVVRDITAEFMLREHMRSLQGDVGRTLHAYTSTLMTVRHKTAIIAEALGPDIFPEGIRPEPEVVVAKMNGPADLLARALERLTAALGGEWAGRGVDSLSWAELGKLEALLGSCRLHVPLEHQHATLTGTARKLVLALERIREGKVPQEAIRDAIRKARELETVGCLAVLREIEASVIEMNLQAEILREYVTTGARPEEGLQLMPMCNLVRQAVSNVREFAAVRGVEVRLVNRSRNVQVRVNERNVRRALMNIVQNAVKYSWTREVEKKSWVEIECFVESGRAYVRCENYGVPIRRDEIDSGRIFQLGYRGVLSSDRGRAGTGVGLFDAMQAARQHGGSVTVESRPASCERRLDEYSAPFLTTVCFWLPISHAEGG